MIRFVYAPPELETEREALIAEIHAAFDGVTREGGVSWNETDVIDMYGSDEERQRARESDADRSWPELLGDPAWHPISSRGSFAFLDAIGFRYYLPAAMVFSLRTHLGDTVESFLTLNLAKKPAGFAMQKHHLEKWSLLDDRQRRCVARYLRFVIAWAEAESDGDTDDVTGKQARKALERYWCRFS